MFMGSWDLRKTHLEALFQLSEELQNSLVWAQSGCMAIVQPRPDPASQGLEIWQRGRGDSVNNSHRFPTAKFSNPCGAPQAACHGSMGCIWAMDQGLNSPQAWWDIMWIDSPQCCLNRNGAAAPTGQLVLNSGWRKRKREGWPYHCHPPICAQGTPPFLLAAAGGKRNTSSNCHLTVSPYVYSREKICFLT